MIALLLGYWAFGYALLLLLVWLDGNVTVNDLWWLTLAAFFWPFFLISEITSRFPENKVIFRRLRGELKGSSDTVSMASSMLQPRDYETVVAHLAKWEAAAKYYRECRAEPTGNEETMRGAIEWLCDLAMNADKAKGRDELEAGERAYEEAAMSSAPLA